MALEGWEWSNHPDVSGVQNGVLGVQANGFGTHKLTMRARYYFVDKIE